MPTKPVSRSRSSIGSWRGTTAKCGCMTRWRWSETRMALPSTGKVHGRHHRSQAVGRGSPSGEGRGGGSEPAQERLSAWRPTSCTPSPSSLATSSTLPAAPTHVSPGRASSSTSLKLVQNLSRLVDDLLDLARIEAGRLDLAIRAVDVGEAIKRVHRMVSVQAAAKGIDSVVTVEPDLPMIAADPDRLTQILLNLVGNAVKFTEQGHVPGAMRGRRWSRDQRGRHGHRHCAGGADGYL